MQLVEHKIYGKGKVWGKRFGGFELYVEFEDGIKRWVRSDEIRFLSEIPLLKKHIPPKFTLSEKQFKYRQIIEALRLGVVPYKYAEEFEELTFGREKEIKNIKEWLDDSQSGSLIVVGEYGVGKTHLLDYIYLIALKEEWAVSIVELDLNEAPFHKPWLVYQKIISSFKFKDKNGDFREFLRQVANSKDYQELRTHEYLSRAVEKIKNGEDDEAMWGWIEGGSTWYYYPTMYRYCTCANIYSYILSGIGWMAKNILGLKGFIILLDEAENMDPYWYSSYQDNKAWNFLKGLVSMSNNDKELLDEVVEEAFYEHPMYKGWWGEYTDLQYCGRSRLPFIWKIPSSVKIVLTLPPVSDILKRSPLNNLKRIDLEHLDSESLMKVFETIINIYQNAYNFKLNRDNQTLKYYYDLIPPNKTRLFIKGTIEVLDLIRFHPDKPVENLLR